MAEEAAALSRQLRNIILCGVVVFALLGVWLLVSLLPEDSAPVSSSESEILPLIGRETTELTSLTVQNAQGTLSFSRNNGGVLMLEGCEDLPRYDTRYTALANAVCSLSASRVISESPKDLGEFGLDTPAATVTAVFSGGVEMVIRIGNQAPDRSGYYLCPPDGTVYLSKTDVDSFFCAPGDFIGLTLIPSASETQTVSIGDVVLGGSVRPSPFTLTAAEGGHSVPLGAGYEAGGERYRALISNLSALSASGAVRPHPDADALSQYGLTSPRSTVAFTRTVEEDGTSSSQSYALLLGDKENGSYYAMLEGIDAVYLLPESFVSWAELSMEDFVSDQPVSLPAADIASFSVESDAVSASFTVTAADGNITGVTANGATVDAGQFQNLYQSFQALCYVSYQENRPEAEPLARIMLTGIDGVSSTFSLIPASARLVYVDVGGSGGFLVKKADAEAFLQRVETLLEGGEVPAGY